MRHIYFFYFFMTIIFGVGSLTITTVLYYKTKERLLQQYLIFYTAFTLVVVCTTPYWYIVANLPGIDPRMLVVLNYGRNLSTYLLALTLPAFMHFLCAVPRASFRNAIFAGIALITFVGANLFEYVIPEDRISRLMPYIEDTIFMVVVLYTLLIGFFYYRRLTDDDRKQAAQKYLVLLLMFFPGLFSDMFSEDMAPLQFFPLLYCCLSVVFTHHFLKHYFHPAPVAAQMMPTEDLFAQYNISLREQEIVMLVLKGYSNQKIADTLFISPNTVKTHLRNIYPKFEVNSRYELFTRFQHPSGVFHSENEQA